MNFDVTYVNGPIYVKFGMTDFLVWWELFRYILSLRQEEY
jgi:hypothetical protein